MPKISANTVVEHRERTYDALLTAVLDLVLERGYEAVTMRDIAERAGVLRTAVYNYAPDKTALLLAAAGRHTAELHDSLEEIDRDPGLSAPQRLENMVRLLFVTFTQTAQNLFMLRTIHQTLTELQREKVIAPFRVHIVANLERILQAGIDAGDFAPVQDFDFTVTVTIGVIDTALENVAHHPEEAARLAETITAFLVRGLAPISEGSA